MEQFSFGGCRFPTCFLFLLLPTSLWWQNLGERLSHEPPIQNLFTIIQDPSMYVPTTLFRASLFWATSNLIHFSYFLDIWIFEEMWHIRHFQLHTSRSLWCFFRWRKLHRLSICMLWNWCLQLILSVLPAPVYYVLWKIVCQMSDFEILLHKQNQISSSPIVIAEVYFLRCFLLQTWMAFSWNDAMYSSSCW